MSDEKRRLVAWLLADLGGVAWRMGPLHPIRHVNLETWLAVHAMRHGIRQSHTPLRRPT